MMGIKCGRALGLLVLSLLLQSCGGPKSSSTGGPNGNAVPTSRMTLWLTVEATDTSTAVVRVNLNDGQIFGESFRLDGGDYLRACSNGVCRNLSDNDSIFNPDYIARLNYQPGVDYVVSFNRQEARDAPDSRVSLPPPFSIVTPASGTDVTDGQDVIVEWSPSGTPLRGDVNYESECTFQSGQQSAGGGDLSTDENGDGREVVSIDEIVDLAQANVLSPITRCTIYLVVSHELRGQADPAYDDGLVRGIVSRKVRLDYLPN